MTWPKHSPEWSRGKSHEYLRPYWDGHMFVAVYLRARGYNLARIGRVIGVNRERVRQLVAKADRIVAHQEARTNILARSNALTHK